MYMSTCTSTQAIDAQHGTQDEWWLELRHRPRKINRENVTDEIEGHSRSDHC